MMITLIKRFLRPIKNKFIKILLALFNILFRIVSKSQINRAKRYDESLKDKKILIYCKSYYQLILAINMSKTIFMNDRTYLIMGNSSKNSNEKKLVDNINEKIEKYPFEKAFFVYHRKMYENLNFSEKKIIKNYVRGAACGDNEYRSIFPMELENLYIDKLLLYDRDLDVEYLYGILSKTNKKCTSDIYEDSPIGDSDNDGKRILERNELYKCIIDFQRLLMGKLPFHMSYLNFYCTFPELKKGDLNCIKIPSYNLSDNVWKELAEAFGIDINSLDDKYNREYIYFPSMYDYENEKGIGEQEIALKIASVVGKENLLVKPHTREYPGTYEKLGLKVVKEAFAPFEIIYLNHDFSNQVFICNFTNAVLTGSIMTGKKQKIRYTYELGNGKDSDRFRWFKSKTEEVLKKVMVDNLDVKVVDSFEEICE